MTGRRFSKWRNCMQGKGVDLPELDVTAAGSLLGVHVARDGSFPVGYVDTLTMRPMDFEEFCWAVDDARAFQLVRDSFAHMVACPLHGQMMKRYRDYLLVGGMPEAVRRFADGARFDQVRQTQEDIATLYLADMAKYATATDATKIVASWSSIPNQLAKESGSTKFVWRDIASGAKSARYSTAVDWLVAAGIVSKCTQVSDGVAPLKAFEVENSFKLYMADTGLLTRAYDARLEDFDDAGAKTARFRGGVAENYVMQQLLAAGVKPYYWGAQSTYEVEFVVRAKEGVVPVEVKSGKRVRSTSALRFAEKYDCPYIVKTTAKNFGAEGKVRSVPLYAACLLGEWV